MIEFSKKLTMRLEEIGTKERELWDEYVKTKDEDKKLAIYELEKEKREALEEETELVKKEIKDSWAAHNGSTEEEYKKELKKKINELENQKRVLEQMKLHGVYGDGPVTDINYSAAIPLGPVDPNAKFDPDSIFNDASSVVDSTLSDEEKRIEFLCGGEKYDERATYDVKRNRTSFRIHYIPVRIDKGCRPGLKNSGSGWKNAKVAHTIRPVAHEVQLGLGYSDPDRNVARYINLFDTNEKGDKEVGYHFLCSDNEIVCFIPWDEIAFHASSRTYNYNSIGIERITTEEVGVDAIYNQAKLVATIMYMQNIPINRIMTHFSATYGLPSIDGEGNFRRNENGDITYATPKSCPDRLINGEYGGLRFFRQVIINCLRTGDLFVKELEDVKFAFEELDRENASLGTEVVIESGGRARQ